MAALIEDYFVVNENQIMVATAPMTTLIDPFCIEGPSVLDFALTASIGFDDTGGFEN